MIQLLPLHDDQAPAFHRWISDPEVVLYSLSAFQAMTTLEQVAEWLRLTLQDTKSLNLGVYLAPTNELIGYAGISNISRINRAGEYFILLGEKRYWGQGIGTAVTRQVVSRGFQDLGLQRIMLTVSVPNEGGVKAYQRAGFQLEGRLRKACYRHNAFHDKLVMSVLREEWLAESEAAG
ncbi:GNAT family N-acetyltransferase [Hymenobacter cellulosivorans]|uniref:GNAT family N-acetyltransferase n=1 Tax=Hymenobacter cellulosivorans TaxID=2932249 RepID=A0ABY4F8K6_9BACT|nr:GNAT family protein [Hymenobacter cellulosivorans]UOQ52259.1 GNAT family N-acetyltransferase [Hymenobacter cellulosivorans]